MNTHLMLKIGIIKYLIQHLKQLFCKSKSKNAKPLEKNINLNTVDLKSL